MSLVTIQSLVTNLCHWSPSCVTRHHPVTGHQPVSLVTILCYWSPSCVTGHHSMSLVIIQCHWSTSCVTGHHRPCGGIEVNPGPCVPSINTDSIRFGSLNIRSAVHKVTLLHDTISDFRLDVLALQETWITADTPLAIKANIAPDGFSAIHVHRPTMEKRTGAAWRSCTGTLSSFVHFSVTT